MLVQVIWEGRFGHSHIGAAGNTCNKILSKNLHFLQDLTTNRDLIGEQINHLHNKKEQ